jgi:hypothetical protein
VAEAPVADAPAAGSPAALLDALSRVPADAATLSSIVSYADYRAIEAAGGAERPASLAILVTALEAGDPAAQAWLTAIQGVASGPSNLLVNLLQGGPDWPTTAGFDFLEVDRAVQFGSPPADGTVLVGSFRPNAVAAAYEARDYVGTAAGERTLWCDAAGCDRGTEVDLSAMDPAMPFGGRVGRRQPMVAGATDLLSSADEGTVRGMLAAVSGETASVAALPAYRALASAPAEDVSITQAMFLPAVTPLELLDIGSEPGAVDAGLAAQLASLPPVAPAVAIGILGGARGDEEVVTVALALPDADAAATAAAIAERLERAPSLREDRPLKDVLADAGVTSVTARTLPASEEVAAAAVVELRAPVVPGDAAGDAVPGRLFRLLSRLVETRDMAWLAASAGSG